ncbi:MAG: DNA polymerase/3'-5' exonuclease PolX [Myxococcota bacterium]
MVLNDKAAVARVLREVALYLQLKGESAFKSRAYENGADRITGLSKDLGELVAQKRLQELPGIGEALAERITELVTTGKLAYYEKLKAEFPPHILELLKVEAVGPKKALALYQALGVGDLESLEAACKEGKVRALKGFGPKSEEKILAGLTLYRRTSADGRRLLHAVLPLAEELLAQVKEAPGVVRASLGGSVRRFCETVADVDLIASAPDPAPVFAAFTRHPQVAQVIGQGGSKCSVRLLDDLQVDVRVLPDEDFATALHHFTGSKAHHIRLRHLAQEKGFTLSEWGAHHVRADGTPGAKVPVRDEAELYRLLGMQYVPPELREDWGEVEAALEGRLPDDLVTLSDVAGNVHSHSTWSDGKGSLEDMARAAKALGLSYLTVTEHSQTAAYAGGLKKDALFRQWDEIDELNQKVKGITLLKGIESDILEDGALDYPDALLERLDLVIGSIHQRYGLDEEKMTRRVLAAFDNPHLHIWGHPTGRLIHRREPVPLRMEEVLDKAAEKGVAIEVNGSPERLDLKAEHVRMALARGVKLVVSTDAHSVEELAVHLPYAVGTARKGWARKQDVLNTLPAAAFLSALRR